MRRGRSLQKNKGIAPTVTLSVKIQPRASRNEIVSMENGGHKIRLTAPPVDGAANAMLVDFLADVLHVARSRVEIVAGQTSRDKRVMIIGMGEEEARQLLNRKKE